MAKRFTEDSNVLVQDDQEVVCAWHNPGKDPKGSHGVCEKCGFRVYGQWKMKKVPSYVERFKDGREA